METQYHSINALFEQLGLASSDLAIEEFLRHHSPLDKAIALHNAPFWTEAQAQALQEMLHEDSDWAVAADSLNSLIR